MRLTTWSLNASKQLLTLCGLRILSNGCLTTDCMANVTFEWYEPISCVKSATMIEGVVFSQAYLDTGQLLCDDFLVHPVRGHAERCLGRSPQKSPV